MTEWLNHSLYQPTLDWWMKIQIRPWFHSVWFQWSPWWCRSWQTSTATFPPICYKCCMNWSSTQSQYCTKWELWTSSSRDCIYPATVRSIVSPNWVGGISRLVGPTPSCYLDPHPQASWADMWVHFAHVLHHDYQSSILSSPEQIH